VDYFPISFEYKGFYIPKLSIPMEEIFKERIKFRGDVKDISIEACKNYDLGEFRSNSLILIGYEDFNLKLETSKSRYLVKVFSHRRTIKNCLRYVDAMERAIEAGIATPKLLKSNQGFLCKIKINNTSLRLCVMEFIEGKTLFELNQKPSQEEIKFLANQAALISQINIKPDFVYDSWAVTNFMKEVNKRSKKLSKEDLTLIKPLIKNFTEMKIDKLPYCFVHGDIINTNVIKDNKGKLWIIDFSVSNYYPRIQELAVLACNLLFDENSKEKSDKNLKVALEEYQKVVKLTDGELRCLPGYIRLAHAMHLLCANYEKLKFKNITAENEYWTTQGRKGLEQTESY
jgi:Ser/Thr protein kinase RdoA (MazF antagonist)